MGDITLATAWTVFLAAVSAFLLLANAAEKIAKARQAAKAPNVEQDKRIEELGKQIEELVKWREEVERKLKSDKQQLAEIHEGLRASYQAQLALLDHGIDGNNIEQMQDAKAVLQQHLINR